MALHGRDNVRLNFGCVALGVVGVAGGEGDMIGRDADGGYGVMHGRGCLWYEASWRVQDRRWSLICA